MLGTTTARTTTAFGLVMCLGTTAWAQRPPVLATVPFDLADVRLLDGPFKQAMDLDQAYLLSLDSDRLLVGFRKNAGLPEIAKTYGGWEARGLDGHSLGHYLSALSLMYSATGDERFLQRVNHIVDELAACQAQAADGFVGAMPKGREIFREIAAGNVKPNSAFHLNGSWVPWYNQHKLFAGLRDAEVYAKSDKAKAVLIKLGDWAIGVCKNLDDRQFQAMLGVEHGGMMDALADLSALTGEVKYLALAKRFWHKNVLDDLAAGKDNLTGKHANTQIPKIIGAARLYELTGDARAKAAAETFWKDVVGSRSFVTGSNSDREHFFPLGIEAGKLGPQNGESCNVYNMLKLTGHLAEWSGRAEWYDYSERALFNHILGSIDPQSGMTTYFQALEPGRFKVYGTPTDAFWCCTGTGMENHAKYGADLYTHAADGSALNVNLFLASELHWKDKGLTLKQETTFPNSDTTTLTLKLDKPTKLALRVRIPGWAERGIDVSGAVTAQGKPGDGYLTIDRTWNDGDSITVRMPMTLRMHDAIDDPKTKAAIYGPIVLAAELGTKDFPKSDIVPDHTVFDLLPVPSVPLVVTDDSSTNWLKPVTGQPLHFTAAAKSLEDGTPVELRFSPMYAIHHQRYATYLRVVDTNTFTTMRQKMLAEQTAARALAARTVDEIVFGEQQPEQDHAVQSANSRSGQHLNRPWRDATSGGFFAFTSRTKPDAAHALRVTYWGGDDGRTFDVLVNDQVIATQTLTAKRPAAFFDVDYAVPKALTAGKDKAVVTFRPKDGSIAGGVFKVLMLTAEPAPAQQP